MTSPEEKNLSDETVKNIVIEVEQDKVGLEWLERRGHPLAPTQRDVDPAPTIYVEAVAKFTKVRSVPRRCHPRCAIALTSQHR